jgi:hypothetical protein
MRTPLVTEDPVKPFDLSNVPIAERPALQAAGYHDTEEQTIWYNPFEYDMAVQIHVGSTPMEGPWDDPGRMARWRALSPQRRREMQTGVRTYVIPAKDARAIPSEYDFGIQQTQCQDQECPGAKALYCRNPQHQKLIVGGLYPRLINKGTRLHPLEKPPTLHYALDDERARAAEALERSKVTLANAAHQQGLALVAAADFEKAKADMAAVEERLAAQGKTEESAQHAQAIEDAKNGKSLKK